VWRLSLKQVGRGGVGTNLGGVFAQRDLHRQFPSPPRARSPLPYRADRGALYPPQEGFYHDGRFGTLANVLDHYNTCMVLRLTAAEKADLVQYLLSLTFGGN
jgi:hypothetical protein